MAITTFAELKSAIADWLARDDLTDRIPDFITLFECEAVRRLGVREAEATTSLTPSAGTVALPSDFLAVRRLTWKGDTRVDLTYVQPSILQATWPTSPSDTPRVYTIEGGNILIRPVDSTALELVYRSRTGAVATTLNWLLTNHSDAYLYGSLSEAYGIIHDFQQAGMFGAKRDAAFDSILRRDFRYRGPMAISVYGPTP